jgi:uncharacterized protein (DUF1778 family)
MATSKSKPKTRPAQDAMFEVLLDQCSFSLEHEAFDSFVVVLDAPPALKNKLRKLMQSKDSPQK